MARDLRDQVVLITGASSGIGRAAAVAFAREGARVVLAARRRDKLEEAVREVEAAGRKARAVVADVAVEADVRAAVEAAANLGGLHILVNNAGIGYFGTVEETPPEMFRRLLEVNLMGMMYGIWHALPIMRRQGRGHIINVASVAGKRGSAGNGAYCATKFAMVGLSESLRVEVAGSGIEVSVVCPVVTDTEFFEAAGRYSPRPGRKRTGPIQTAEHVARAIVRCAKRPRPEVMPFPPARILVAINAIAPRLADRIMLFYRDKMLGEAR